MGKNCKIRLVYVGTVCLSLPMTKQEVQGLAAMDRGIQLSSQTMKRILADIACLNYQFAVKFEKNVAKIGKNAKTKLKILGEKMPASGMQALS